MLYSKYPANFVFVIAVSFFPLLTLPPFAFAQKESDAVFILKGNTRLPSGKGLEGVELELKKKGQTIEKLLTGKHGKYTLKLPISTLDKNNEFSLSISKTGTIPKSIRINTYIPAEEYATKTFPSYLFELEIKMIETTEKTIVDEKPAGRITWDNEQHAFAFDQTFAKYREDETEKLQAEKKKREEEERARLKAEEEARLKAEAEFDRLAQQRSREEADRILKKNLEAMRNELKRKRMQDSLDRLAGIYPGSLKEVDPFAFDAANAYSINIAKKWLKASQEKMSREKASNLSAKYETNNTLTSLLNMVDEHAKNQRSPR